MPSPLLNELGELVKRAGSLAQLERAKMTSEFKQDGSVVTNGDRAVEVFLREELPAIVSNASIWGEEFGWEAPGPEGMWVVDPIDGTSNFSFGHILWGVTVALVQNDEIELGAIYLPDLDELYLAERNQGAWFNDEPMAQIPPGPIQHHELVSYDDGLILSHLGIELPGKQRLSGAFVVDGAFTAKQRIRGMIGRREKLYDIAATILINEECGAEIRNADGSEFALKPLIGGEKVKQPWLLFPKDNGFYLK